ncbi:hypothetical protein Tco_0160701, partial [Tanacetum coccineum]
MQTQESKIDTGKALDADLVDTESIRTDSDPFMTKSQWLRVDQYPETCQDKSPMLDSSPDNQTTEYSKQSLELLDVMYLYQILDMLCLLKIVFLKRCP